MWAYWPILGADTALFLIFRKKWKVKFKAVCLEGTPYITGDLFAVFVVLRPQSIT